MSLSAESRDLLTWVIELAPPPGPGPSVPVVRGGVARDDQVARELAADRRQEHLLVLSEVAALAVVVAVVVARALWLS